MAGKSSISRVRAAALLLLTLIPSSLATEFSSDPGISMSDFSGDPKAPGGARLPSTYGYKKTNKNLETASEKDRDIFTDLLGQIRAKNTPFPPNINKKKTLAEAKTHRIDHEPGNSKYYNIQAQKGSGRGATKGIVLISREFGDTPKTKLLLQRAMEISLKNHVQIKVKPRRRTSSPPQTTAPAGKKNNKIGKKWRNK